MFTRRTAAWSVAALALVASLCIVAAVLAARVATARVLLLVAPALVAALVASALFTIGWPRTRVIHAIRDGILQLKEEDFNFAVARTGDRQLDELATAFNSLVETLRKQQLDLRQREFMLDAILQTTPMAILLLDQWLRVVYGNIESRNFFASSHKLEGLSFRELLGRLPEPARTVLSASNDGLFTIQKNAEAQTWHVSSRVFTLNSRPHRLILLKQLTRELTTQELAMWKKMMKLLAHELNNSLAPIASLCRSGRKFIAGHNATDLAQVFATIESRADHLASFIDGWARFTRLPMPRPQRLHWRRFLDPLGDSLDCRIDVADAMLMGTFDPSQLEQVLINLVKNAHESGSPPEEVCIAVREMPQGFAIEVSDRGSGLPQDALANALLPFFSTKASGTGLGLTLCREIVHAHGGHLTIANRVDGGAVVTIFLPKRPVP